MRVDAQVHGKQQDTFLAPDGFHPDGQRGKLKARFASDVTIHIPRQKPRDELPDSRLWKGPGIKNELWRGMMPYMWAKVTGDGFVLPVENRIDQDRAVQVLHERDGSTPEVNVMERVGDTFGDPLVNNDRLFRPDELNILMPSSPWARRALMVMHSNLTQRFIDMSPDQQHLHMATQGSIIEAFQEANREEGSEEPVFWGMNTSTALTETGLVSIPYIHSVTFTNTGEAQRLTIHQNKKRRNTQTWDNGVSRYFGARVVTDIKDRLIPGYWDTDRVESSEDAMGLSVNLKGFKPSDMRDPRFAKFWADLSKSMQAQIQAASESIFTGDIDVMNQLALETYESGELTNDKKAHYESQFSKKEKHSLPHDHGVDLDIVAKVHHLYDAKMLRRPPGWTVVGHFTDEGATFFLTFGFLDKGPNGDGINGLGPIESLGINMDRPLGVSLSDAETTANMQAYQRAVERVSQNTPRLVYAA